MIYSPSLACANQLNLIKDIDELLSLGFELLHFDVMDGHYVPCLCLSLDTGKALRKQYPGVRLDVHLMVDNPGDYIEPFAAISAERLAFHFDAAAQPGRLIELIHKNGMKAGIVLNPLESASTLAPVMELIDFVTVMGIKPGFPGRKYMEETDGVISDLVKTRKERNLNFEIAVDGGITPAIAGNLKKIGADILVLGYLTIFNQPEGITGAWRKCVESL